MTAIVLDTETTGFNEPELIEAAYLQVDVDADGVIYFDDKFVQRYKPQKDIEHGAMAVHGIIPNDLADMPPSSEFKLPDGIEYLIGHNIDYDAGVIGNTDIKRICTLAMSRKLFPDASHKQSAMIYHLLSPDYVKAKLITQKAHSALDDVEACAVLLGELIEAAELIQSREINSLEDLYEFSEACRVPETFTFGKHKDQKIVDVKANHPDYVKWVLGNVDDLDPLLRKELEK